MNAIDSIHLAHQPEPLPVPAVAGVHHVGASDTRPHEQDKADISPQAAVLSQQHEHQRAETSHAHPRHHPGPVAPAHGALEEAQATLRADLDPPVGNAREPRGGRRRAVPDRAGPSLPREQQHRQYRVVVGRLDGGPVDHVVLVRRAVAIERREDVAAGRRALPRFRPADPDP